MFYSVVSYSSNEKLMISIKRLYSDAAICTSLVERNYQFKKFLE